MISPLEVSLVEIMGLMCAISVALLRAYAVFSSPDNKKVGNILALAMAIASSITAFMFVSYVTQL